MPTDKLGDPKARQAKLSDKPYKLFDGGGLFLLVKPEGTKLWRLKYRFGGKEKLLAIGSYDKGVSLKKAREERDKARNQLVEGIDPAVAKKEEKRAERELAENTFKAIALNWAKTYGARWTESHRDQVLASLEANAFPALGDFPIKEITPPMVLEVIIEAREAAEAGARAALEALAVHHYEPYPHMKPAQRQLRNQLRARARQLGDRQDASGRLAIDHLLPVAGGARRQDASEQESAGVGQAHAPGDARCALETRV